jgi:hypothetical protein
VDSNLRFKNEIRLLALILPTPWDINLSFALQVKLVWLAAVFVGETLRVVAPTMKLLARTVSTDLARGLRAGAAT